MLQQLIDKLIKQYPGLELLAKEYRDSIYLNWLKVPANQQNRGIGSHVLQALQHYAQYAHKDVVLEPSPERGKWIALVRFYKRHGFIPNKGQELVVSYYRQYAETMYWRPTKEKTPAALPGLST
jgi:ribosomal protein S18 acetylase RimI-like enzyme